MKRAQILPLLEKKLGELKLRMPDRPVHPKTGESLDPKLPADLTVLTDERLGRLYGQFCAMAQYAQLNLAMLSVKRAISKTQEKYARATAYLAAEGSREVRAKLEEVDTTVQSRVNSAILNEGVERLTEAMFESYIIGKDALSRELTRRQGVAENPELGRRRR